MATTTIQPLPYPAPGDSPDVPRDLKALAEAVEGRTVMRFASTAARDAALPSGKRVAGMHTYIEAESAVYVWTAGAWRRAWAHTLDAALDMSNGFSPAIAGGWNGMTIREAGQLVVINGLFTRATGWSAGTTIGTVPAGWAPLRREAGIGLDVMSSGEVVATAPAAGGALVSGKVVYPRPA